MGLIEIKRIGILDIMFSFKILSIESPFKLIQMTKLRGNILKRPN